MRAVHALAQAPAAGSCLLTCPSPASRLHPLLYSSQLLPPYHTQNSKVLFKHLRHQKAQFESHTPVSVHVNVRSRGG